MRASILGLPTELLLQICDHFEGRGRNSDLHRLSLTCRKFRPIAHEKLLCAPTFKLTHIHEYVYEIGHHAHFIPKITRLEIFSTSEGRVKKAETSNPQHHAQPSPGVSIGATEGEYTYPDVLCPAEIAANSEFRQKCLGIVDFYTQDDLQSRLHWRVAMNIDIVQALLGILFVILPNLKELYLGASWMVDFPIFSNMLYPSISRVSPKGWSHPWMNCILSTMKPKIEVLEVPAIFESLGFNAHTVSVFDFRSFSNLVELGLSMHVLLWSKRRRMAPASPAHIFPPSLQKLRISECTAHTSNFINELCLSKKKKDLPNLTHLELYFEDDVDYIREHSLRFRNPDPVGDVRRMCADAKIELYMYFPSFELKTEDIGGTPWSFREEGPGVKGLEEAERRAYSEGLGGFVVRSVELRSDVQGDIDMAG